MTSALEELNKSFNHVPTTKSGMQVEIERSEALNIALDRIEQLKDALEQQDPGIGNYLNQINVQLRQFPELVHILDDEQIAVVVQAHCRKKFELLGTKEKKAKGGKKAAQLDDGSLVADLLD